MQLDFLQNDPLFFSKHKIFITAKNALLEPLQLIQLWAQEVFHTYHLCQNGNISKAFLKSIDDWLIQIPKGIKVINISYNIKVTILQRTTILNAYAC